MLRFDPGFGRVRNARSFQVWEGGGEYNVARAMRKCWGKRATVVTALPINDLGWLVEDFIMQGGVDTSHIIWRDFDGLGRNTRVGLNFTEKGFGIRAALGCSDRGHSAASQIRPGEVNWEKLFGEEGVRWFHTGGIFAALAPNTSEAVIEAVEIARKYGTIVVLRPQLPRIALEEPGRQGRRAEDQPQHREIRRCDDRQRGRLHRLPRLRSRRPRRAHLRHRPGQLQEDDPDRGEAIPELQGRGDDAAQREDRDVQRLVGDPVRRRQFYQSMMRNLAIRRRRRRRRLRIGPGLRIHGRQRPAGGGVEYGAAHGALAMTTPGDTSMVNVKEVEAVMKGKGARVIR